MSSRHSDPESRNAGGPQPTVRVEPPYSVPRSSTPIDLHLDGNEGSRPPAELLDGLREDAAELFRSYPKGHRLQSMLAERLGVQPDRVLLTNGGDDSIDRICRGYLAPGLELIVTRPSFEMVPRFARLAGGEVREVDWYDGEFPLDDVVAALNPKTAVVVVGSPNNPTGTVFRPEHLRSLSEAAPDALLLVDLAYVEFADLDLTATALECSNAVVVRTLSKAWGLAGLRVGYSVGPKQIIDTLRCVGGPFPVSALSEHIAAARLISGEEQVAEFVGRIREERSQLISSLACLGARPTESQANFVFVDVDDGLWFRDMLAGMGIAVRAFPDDHRLARFVRITCPGNKDGLARLLDAITVALRPEALAIDIDSLPPDAPPEGLRSIRSELESISSLLSLVALGQSSAASMRKRLEAAGVSHLFDSVAGSDSCGPAETSESIRAALGSAGKRNAWLISASPAWIAAARGARIPGLGWIPGETTPRDDPRQLVSAGAGRVLRNLGGLLTWLESRSTP